MTGSLATTVWTEVGESPLVLVPLGSTEQHGPHLPFTTDTDIAGAVIGRLVATRFPDAVVPPPLPFGASGEHQDFSGTISIGTEALRFVLVELVRSLSTWAGRIVIVNGHGGNLGALSDAIPQMRREGHDVGWVPCAVRGADAHAGRTETSIMLSLDAARVNMAAAVVGTVAPLSEMMTELVRGGTRAVSASGILGDPTGATADEGRVLLDEMVAGAARRIVADNVDARGCLSDPGVRA